MKHQVRQERQDDSIASNSETNDAIAKQCVDAAFQVHNTVGPGLLESAYETFMIAELRDRGLELQSQKPLQVQYKSTQVEMAYRLDLVVEDRVLIELKSVENIMPIHEAQMLTYLRLSGYPLGLLINFNKQRIKDGIKRYAI